MLFEAESAGWKVPMDAKKPIGKEQAMTPKELVVAGLGGCTAMDVVALMKKHKEPLESLEIETKVSQTESGQPRVFKEVSLTFFFKGDLNKERVLEAVRLSQTQYCGVSAMIVKTAPIHYKVVLNEIEIGEGAAEFAGR
jgi:putative redox protein